jgi:hypothetical protein
MKLSDIPDGMAFMCLTNLYVKFDGIDKNCFNPIDGV